MSASSTNQVVVKISEDKMLFDKSAMETKEQSEDYPAKSKPKTSSSQTQVVFADVDVQNNDACTIIEIPEPSSLDNSFACSSLSRSSTGTAPQSSSSLSSVLLLELTSEPITQSSMTSETDRSMKVLPHSLPLPPTTAMSSASESKISSGSPISLSAINLTFQEEVPTETPASVPEIRLTLESETPITSDSSPAPNANCQPEEAVVSIAKPSFDLNSPQSSSSLHPAALKESMTVKFSSSGELSRTTSVATDTSASSTECFKSPVAQRNDVVVTIRDDKDKKELTVDKATDRVVADILTSKDDTCSKLSLER